MWSVGKSANVWMIKEFFSLVDLLNETRKLFLIIKNPTYQTYNNQKKTLLALGCLFVFDRNV